MGSDLDEEQARKILSDLNDDRLREDLLAYKARSKPVQPLPQQARAMTR